MVVKPSASPEQGNKSKGSPGSAEPQCPLEATSTVHGSTKKPRYSVPSIVLTPPIASSDTPKLYRLEKRSSLPVSAGRHSSHQDLSEFALPGLDEEELDGGEFRQRSGSTGLKSIIKFRSRHKSGDIKTGSPYATPQEDRKGFKGLFDAFRPRSKSDAAALRQAAMMRKKHSSGGSNAGSAVQQVLTADTQQNLLGAGDMEPVNRPRSTSLGAKDRLRMIKKDMRVTGPSPSTGTDKATTLMGRLMASNTHSNQNGGQTSSSSSSSEKTSSASMDPQEHHYTGQALIWQHDGEISSDLERLQIEDIEENDPLVFNKFMRAHKCYDIIPNSSKLVVFDTSLSVKKAFYALVHNCVRAAPLWDHDKQQFIGMLTITDFILILHKYYRSPQEKLRGLEEHMISTWRNELSSHYRPFISVSPEDSVCTAVRKLHKTKVHRLPVIDPVSGNAVFIITHKRILKFLHLFMKNLPKPAYVNESIESLQIGTYDKLVKITSEDKVIDAIGLFVKTRVSALPVVDADNKVVDIYAKFDVINLAATKSYGDLDATVATVLQHRLTKTEHVLTCHRTDTFGKVIEKIVKAGVHRLVITKADNELDGVISLSDIISFLLQEDSPGGASMSTSSCAAMSTEANHSENNIQASKVVEATG